MIINQSCHISNQSANGAEAHDTIQRIALSDAASIQWAVSSNSFLSVLLRLVM